MISTYLRHLRPEVDLLQVDRSGGQVVQHLAQEHAVSERLGQVEDDSRGPDHPVIRRQDLAVDQPPSTLPPLLHGDDGKRNEARDSEVSKDMSKAFPRCELGFWIMVHRTRK